MTETLTSPPAAGTLVNSGTQRPGLRMRNALMDMRRGRQVDQQAEQFGGGCSDRANP